jgi:hypothetical protein
MYAYPIRLVDRRRLHMTTQNSETIDRVHLPELPSQLTLFAQDNAYSYLSCPCMITRLA